MKAAIVIAASVVLGTASLGSAHEGATGVLKQRMDGMESMSRAMKAIRQHMQVRNFAAIQTEAIRIRELASSMPSWFPPGSDAKPSEVLPTVWQRWSDFQARATRLEQESTNLASLAFSGESKGISDQFRIVGKTCASCHEMFRQKR